MISCTDATNTTTIAGEWYLNENEKEYLRITEDEFIVMNDSPVAHSYSIHGDSLIVRFETTVTHEWKIEKLTSDSLVLAGTMVTIRLHKK